ncbi:nuclear transport factor 2 family protein, partial [Klebsiella pneumoniae]|nr:nuclear transport factor 2 family protein [Klebsiella pneumoniae]
RINTHYLSSEFIYLNEINEATGRWKMLQLSTFNNGQSHLNGAELIIEFRRENNIWLINHFTTRNLFSRP